MQILLRRRTIRKESRVRFWQSAGGRLGWRCCAQWDGGTHAGLAEGISRGAGLAQLLAFSASQDEFLVMASDGLFDVMEDQSIIDAVGNHLKEHKSYTGAADKLTALAIEKGSLDNVTVVIISFIWGADAVDAHVS